MKKKHEGTIIKKGSKLDKLLRKRLAEFKKEKVHKGTDFEDYKKRWQEVRKGSGLH